MKKIHNVRNVFHSFKLVGETGSTNKHIFLDGIELKGVKSSTLVWEVGEVPRVFLEIESPFIEAEEPVAAVFQYREENNDGADEVRQVQETPEVQ